MEIGGLERTGPINAIKHEQARFIKVGLDSCAGDSVCPLELAPACVASESQGKRYRVANGTIIHDAGSITAAAQTWAGVPLSLALTRCSVHNPVLSAGKQVRSGGIIHLELNNSWLHFRVPILSLSAWRRTIRLPSTCG